MLKLFFLITFLSFNLFAAIDKQCESVASKYLVRGKLQSPFGGDRLWALDRLNGDYQADKSAICLEVIRQSALDDAKEYWLGYVATKFSCNSEDSLTLPPQRPNNCPEDKFETIKKNASYISAIENNKVSARSSVSKRKKDENCDSRQKPLKTARQAAGQIVDHLNQQDPCAKFGYASEHLKGKTPTDSELNKLGSCLVGSGKGLSGLGNAVKSAYQTLSKFVSDPMYRASVMTAVSDFTSLLATHPTRVLNAMYEALQNEFHEFRDELACLNPNGKVMKMCELITKEGLPAILGIGAIRKIVANLKAGTKATNGALVVRDAAQSASRAATTASPVSAGATRGTGGAAASSTATDSAGAFTQNTGKTTAQSSTSGAKAATQAEADAAQQARSQAAEMNRKKAAAEAEAEAKNNRNRISSKDTVESKNLSSFKGRNIDDVRKALDMNENATKDEIKKRIRELRSKYHPDRNPDFKAISNEVTTKLNDMFNLLK